MCLTRPFCISMVKTSFREPIVVEIFSCLPQLFPVYFHPGLSKSSSSDQGSSILGIDLKKN